MKENVCEECGERIVLINTGVDLNKDNSFAKLDLYQCTCCKRLSYIKN